MSSLQPGTKSVIRRSYFEVTFWWTQKLFGDKQRKWHLKGELSFNLAARRARTFTCSDPPVYLEAAPDALQQPGSSCWLSALLKDTQRWLGFLLFLPPPPHAHFSTFCSSVTHQSWDQIGFIFLPKLNLKSDGARGQWIYCYAARSA